MMILVGDPSSEDSQQRLDDLLVEIAETALGFTRRMSDSERLCVIAEYAREALAIRVSRGEQP